MLDPVIPDLLGATYEALLNIPGVRFVMGLASPNWRPLWAVTWTVGLVYLAVRAVESAQRTALYRRLGAQPAVRAPTVLSVVLPDAPADPVVHEEPVPPEPLEPLQPTAAARSGATKRRPSLAVRAALGTAAVGMVLAITSLFSGASERDTVSAVPSGEALLADTAAPLDVAAPFSFAARGWRSEGGACVATLEVTGAAQPAGPLTMFVMDAAGTVLGTATLRVGTLTTGAFHEFRFPGVDCDAITQWQVQG
jgi:hypothetical protein